MSQLFFSVSLCLIELARIGHSTSAGSSSIPTSFGRYLRRLLEPEPLRGVRHEPKIPKAAPALGPIPRPKDSVPQPEEHHFHHTYQIIVLQPPAERCSSIMLPSFSMQNEINLLCFFWHLISIVPPGGLSGPPSLMQSKISLDGYLRFRRLDLVGFTIRVIVKIAVGLEQWCEGSL